MKVWAAYRRYLEMESNGLGAWWFRQRLTGGAAWCGINRNGVFRGTGLIRVISRETHSLRDAKFGARSWSRFGLELIGQVPTN